MARYVIDAPTLLHLVAEGVKVSPEHQLVAPNLIRSQALSLLLEAVRHGDITEEVALQRHERLTELKMRLLGDRVSRRTAWTIAQEQGWETTFDAEYLAVTKLQADALVTIDPSLAAKAGSHRAGRTRRGAVRWTDHAGHTAPPLARARSRRSRIGRGWVIPRGYRTVRAPSIRFAASVPRSCFRAGSSLVVLKALMSPPGPRRNREDDQERPSQRHPPCRVEAPEVGAPAGLGPEVVPAPFAVVGGVDLVVTIRTGQVMGFADPGIPGLGLRSS